jgi:carbonic anhydrase
LEAKQALDALLAGNNRFVASKLAHPNSDAPARAALVANQKPFAIIISCSDSRVSPNILFDQGLGDLFEIRLAGNVASEFAIESIEYAIEHLGPKLILVMSHSNCGAVTACFESKGSSNAYKNLMLEISPAVEENNTLEGAIIANAKNTAKKLATVSSTISEYVKKHKVEIYTAHYNLKSGVVSLTSQYSALNPA